MALRVAGRGDVRGIQRVRHAVRENRLVSRVIGDDEVIDHVERLGRGWVVTLRGEVAHIDLGSAKFDSLPTPNRDVGATLDLFKIDFVTRF